MVPTSFWPIPLNSTKANLSFPTYLCCNYAEQWQQHTHRKQHKHTPCLTCCKGSSFVGGTELFSFPFKALFSVLRRLFSLFRDAFSDSTSWWHLTASRSSSKPWRSDFVRGTSTVEEWPSSLEELESSEEEDELDELLRISSGAGRARCGSAAADEVDAAGAILRLPPSLGMFNHFTSSVWHKVDQAWSGAKNPLDSRFRRIVPIWTWMLLFVMPRLSGWKGNPPVAISSRSSTFFWSPDDIWPWHWVHTTDQLQCDVVSLVRIGVPGQLHPRRCRHDTLKGNKRVKHKGYWAKRPWWRHPVTCRRCICLKLNAGFEKLKGLKPSAKQTPIWHHVREKQETYRCKQQRYKQHWSQVWRKYPCFHVGEKSETCYSDTFHCSVAKTQAALFCGDVSSRSQDKVYVYYRRCNALRVAVKGMFCVFVGFRHDQ